MERNIKIQRSTYTSKQIQIHLKELQQIWKQHKYIHYTITVYQENKSVVYREH